MALHDRMTTILVMFGQLSFFFQVFFFSDGAGSVDQVNPITNTGRGLIMKKTKKEV